MKDYKYLEIGKTKLTENIKLLLYKEKNNVFEMLDYENDPVFQEPLFFAYFKNKKEYKLYLNLIIYGYVKSDIYFKEIQVKSDELGRIYFPNVGWFKMNTRNQVYTLKKDKKINLLLNGENCDYTFEPIEYIKGTGIEILKYPVPLLNQFYYDEYLNRIEVEIEKITKTHIDNATKAFNLIKEHALEYYKLLREVTKKIVIFNVNTNLRNSFATLSAQGIAFFNAYQDNYNEVFFIDDIAHQTGHIIFNAVIYDIDDFINVPTTTVVEELKNSKGKIVETRDIHVVFHALYTYYTTFICLDAMLEAKVFEDEKLHELLGRMKFYIGKCYLDLKVVDNFSNFSNGSEKLFTQKGLEIYVEIKNKYFEIVNKLSGKIDDLRLENQGYNFSYLLFSELNPLK